MQVGMAWWRPLAYDEWDALATAVFGALVVEPLRDGVQSVADEPLVLPEYDLLPPDYDGWSVLEVISPEPSGRLLVLHALGPRTTHSTRLRCAKYVPMVDQCRATSC